MNLQERLQALVNHEVIINLLGSRDEDGLPEGVPPGRIREVGEGYVTIQTKSEVEGGFAYEGGEWLVPLQYITSIIHMNPECSGCAGDMLSTTQGHNPE